MHRGQKKKHRFFSRKQKLLLASVGSIKHLIGQIHESGQISRSQHLYLVNSLLSNDTNTQEYRGLINQVLEATQSGALQLVD